MKISPVILLLALLWFAPAGAETDTISFKQLEDSSNRMFQQASKLMYNKEYNKAKKKFIQCLKFRQKIYDNNHFKLATVNENLGYIYLIELDYDSAIHCYEKAEELFKKNNKTERLGSIYNSIGLIYYEKGEYQKALEYFNICENFYKKLHSEVNSLYFLHLYMSIADVYLELNYYNQAEQYYNQSLKIALKDHKSFVPFLYVKLSHLHIFSHNYKLSQESALKGIQFISNKDPENKKDLAILYNNLGYALLMQEDITQAEKYLTKCYQLNIELYSAKNYRNINILIDLGSLYEKKQMLKEALKKYQLSINLLSNTENSAFTFNPKPDQFFDKMEAFKPLALKRDMLYRLFRKTKDFKYMDAALQTAQLSIDLLDELHNSFQTRESKLFLAENENQAYIKALFLAKEAWKATGNRSYLEQAFAFTEKGKSAVLLSAIRNSEAKVSGKLPGKLLQQEQDFDRQIAFYNDLLYQEKQREEPDDEKISRWENKLFYLKRDREAFIENIEKKYPEYYHLKYNTGVVSSKQMQDYLGHHTTLIEYEYSDTVIYAFVMNRNHFELLEIPVDKTFNEALDNYLTAYQQFDIMGQGTDDKIFFDASYILYRSLVEPLEPYIKNKKLLVVPDDKLAYLPFEALLYSEPALPVSNYKNLDYLITKYTISYIYSSTLLLEKRTIAEKHNSILAFAPDYEVKKNSQKQLTVLDKLRMSLPDLKGTYEETEFLRKHFNARIFEGDSATEYYFDTYAPRFNILHLAMHTLIDDENPMFSKLVFAQPLNNKTDGFINTHELYNMKLNARLAVLSSCSTGEGKINKGEGVMNLSRGFFYAGCPSLIITLWKVNDKSGTELMEYFYEELQKGKSKPEALRDAKLRYLENARPEVSHPFFWATYVNVGNPDAIYPKKRNKLFLLFIPVILIGMGIIYRRWLMK